MVLIFFIYGLAFFTLGLAVALYPKKSSAFRLAGELRLIAAFGLLHGANEWVDMFILLGGPLDVQVLKIIRSIVLPVSFLTLVYFGAKSLPGLNRRFPFLRAMPMGLFVIWTFATIFSADRLLMADITARYFLGVPGIALTCYALMLHASEFRASGLVSASQYLKVSAGGFLLYGIFSGFVVPDAGFFPASVFNYSLFLDHIGVPVQLLRALCAVLLAICFLKVLGYFEMETLVSLSRARDELEGKVQTRTESLANANSELEREIAKHRQADLKVRESEEKYRSLVESSSDSIFLLDAEMRYLFANGTHLKRIGQVSSDEVAGKHYFEFHSKEGSDEFVQKVKRVFGYGEPMQQLHESHRDGRFFLRTLSPTINAAGKIFALTITSKDVTEQQRMEEKLRKLSLTDEMTGLYNRRGFNALLQQEFKMANRLNRGFYMLFADLDDLKGINDRFGHNAGDDALKDATAALKETFRDSDIIARVGGDEFVVAPIETDGESINIISTRLKEAIDSLSAGRDREYSLSISIGLAFFDPKNPITVSEFLSDADKSMYDLKRGRQGG